VVAVWCKEKKKEEEANESKQVDKQSGARRSGLVVQVDGGVATMGKVRCACMNQIKNVGDHGLPNARSRF
jgi:hypothetical protein